MKLLKGMNPLNSHFVSQFISFRGVGFAIALSLTSALLSSCGRMNSNEMFIRGLKELQSDKFSASVKHIERAIELRPTDDPDNAEAYNYLGLAYWKLGNTKMAADSFENSHKVDDTYFPSHYNYGMLNLELDQASVAEYYFGRARDLNPSDINACIQLGKYYLDIDKVTTADSVFIDALDRAKVADRPQVLTYRALADIKDGQDANAVARLTDALKYDPNYAPALFNLARIFEATERTDNAVRYYQRHVQVETDSTYKNYSLNALARLKPGNTDEMDAIARHRANQSSQGSELAPSIGVIAPDQVPDMPKPRDRGSRVENLLDGARQHALEGKESLALSVCVQAANMAAADGDSDLVEKSYRTATELYPSHAKANFLLGRHLKETNKLQESLKYLTKAAQLSPQTYTMHMERAEAAKLYGDDQQYIKALRSADATDPKKPEPLWRIASYFEDILPSSAYDYFNDFQRRFPDEERATDAMSRMKKLQKELGASDLIPTSTAKPTATASSSTLGSTSQKKASTMRHEITRIRPMVTKPDGTGQEVTRLAVAEHTSSQTLVPSGGPSIRPTVPSTPITTDTDRPKISLRSDPGTSAGSAANANTGVASKPVTEVPLADELFGQAFQLQQAGKEDEAIRLYKMALTQNNRHVEALFNLGFIHQRKNELADAKTLYHQVLAVNQNLYLARFNLALIHQQEGNAYAAKVQLDNVLRIEPDYGLAHFTIGSLYAESGTAEDNVRTRDHFSRFVELEPSHPKAGSAKEWLANHPE